MGTKENFWEAFSLPFNNNMLSALQLQHQAAQFIAMVGRYLVPQEDDDSNTNMRLDSVSNSLVGNSFAEGVRLGLQLNNLELRLLDPADKVNLRIPLHGKTKEQVFEQLKQSLSDMGIDTHKLSKELHYELPQHAVQNGQSFDTSDSKALSENTLCRRDADLILKLITAPYPAAEEVCIWPHHFDTGTLIPLSRDASGKLSRSLGLGWAIPDTMVNEPYFYISLWSAEAVTDFNSLADLEAGSWIKTGWTGAVLPHSEILRNSSAGAQFNLVKLFFTSAIELLSKRYGK